MAQKYFIQLQYLGTNYHGWQIQPNAITVQEKLDHALSTLLNQKIETVGCGRTDTGVHASDFYAHFITKQKIEDVEKKVNALNIFLPKDISVLRIIEVDENAHARFDAIYRTYRYNIHLLKNPFVKDVSCKVNVQLNLSLMNEAAEILKEYSDFTSFSKTNTQVFTNNCSITKAKWHVLNDNQYYFEITADRFLRNMVRAIVGTLFLVGTQKRTIEEFRNIIESKNRKQAGKSVDACGLFLFKVGYSYL